MQPLPSNYTELSDLLKRIDEDAEAVRTEAREKLDARREKIRTNLAERMDRLESNLEKVQGQTSADWTALREKVKSDRERFKAKLGERKEAYKAFFADSSPEAKKLGAAIAIDYAIATVQQARLAVLDAVSERAEAMTAEIPPTPVS
jgi:DNA repair exonuclease SbcCD ATPase subunit